LGWVKRVYREGSRLLADFADMPRVVYDLIKQGAYKYVSVELLSGIKADTRIIPWVLDAVALLGADQPAVGTLKDLQALTMRRTASLRGGKRVTFRRNVKFTEDRKIMNEEEIKKLIEKATAPLQSALDSAKTESKAEFTRLADEAKKKDEAHQKELAKIHRERIQERFNRAIEAGELLPAKRDQFTRLTQLETDERVMSIKFEDVDTFITENKQATKLKRKDPSSETGEAEESEEGLRPDQVLAQRAEKLCYSRQQDPRKGGHYDRAVAEVLKSDAKLAQAYMFMPDTEYRAA
jgi:DNA-binding transcriptional regulator GbsR (MarR family)